MQAFLCSFTVSEKELLIESCDIGPHTFSAYTHNSTVGLLLTQRICGYPAYELFVVVGGVLNITAVHWSTTLKSWGKLFVGTFFC